MNISERYASASSPGKSYEAIVNHEGRLSCNCRGWIIKKNGKARSCSHIDRLVAKHRLPTANMGDYRYVVEATSLPAASGPARQLRLVPVAEAVELLPWPKPLTTHNETSRFPGSDEPPPSQVPAPMLASPMPDGYTLETFCQTNAADTWAMEEKYDGHRLVIQVQDGAARGWSRQGIERELPIQIKRGFTNFPTGIYDGEILIPGMHSYDVVNGAFAGQEVFVVFDVLSLLNRPTIHETYERRRSYLDTIFAVGSTTRGAIQLAQQFTPSVAAVQAIWDRGGEGAILKRKAGTYQPGYRSRDFVKVKAVHTAVMTVTGYEAKKSGPHSTVVLRGDDGSITKVKTVDNAALRAFDANPQSFIGRKLRIEFQERTPSGNYRHPMWDRFEDE
jgi:ATP dependent DNA ligase domain